jgi:hypothetical protein
VTIGAAVGGALGIIIGSVGGTYKPLERTLPTPMQSCGV